MNQKKRIHGFTLVEAIVTAVIVAILATTATMMYRGYIEDSRQRNVESLAEAASASANAYFRRTGTHPANENDLQLHLANPAQYTVVIDDVARTVTVTDILHNNLSASANY